MSPGHAVLLCRRLPDFVVATDVTTRCRRERIPTAMESAIRARFVRDSFHSLITGLSLSCHAWIRQCGVVDLARFARSGLLRSRFACFLPIAAIALICAPPHLGSALHRSRGNKGIRRRWRGRTALGSACGGEFNRCNFQPIISSIPRWWSRPYGVCRAWWKQVSCGNEMRTAPGAALRRPHELKARRELSTAIL